MILADKQILLWLVPGILELLARQGSLKSIQEEDSAANHFYSTTKETAQTVTRSQAWLQGIFIFLQISLLRELGYENTIGKLFP